MAENTTVASYGDICRGYILAEDDRWYKLEYIRINKAYKKAVTFSSTAIFLVMILVAFSFFLQLHYQANNIFTLSPEVYHSGFAMTTFSSKIYSFFALPTLITLFVSIWLAIYGFVLTQKAKRSTDYLLPIHAKVYSRFTTLALIPPVLFTFFALTSLALLAHY